MYADTCLCMGGENQVKALRREREVIRVYLWHMKTQLLLFDLGDTVILTITSFPFLTFYYLSGGLSLVFQLSKLSLPNVCKRLGLVNRYLYWGLFSIKPPNFLKICLFEYFLLSQIYDFGSWFFFKFLEERVKLSWPLSTREAVLHYFLFEYFQDDLIVVLLNSVGLEILSGLDFCLSCNVFSTHTADSPAVSRLKPEVKVSFHYCACRSLILKALI